MGQPFFFAKLFQVAVRKKDNIKSFRIKRYD